MKKNKVGLLSLSNAENYGAVLQCYSLYRYCKKISSKNIAVINYFPPFMREKYKLFWIDSKSLKSIIRTVLEGLVLLPFSATKKIKFLMFRRKRLDNSVFSRVTKLEDIYDEYIVGSDQVWNPHITREDSNFFLEFVSNDKKKYSYAASLGVQRLDPHEVDFLIQQLRNFTQISIREREMAEYLNKIFMEKSYEKTIISNIDPVFLTTKNEWRMLYKKRKRYKKYILIYSFENIDLAISISKKIAMQLDYDCEIIMIRCCSDYYYKGVRCQRAVGPIDFLELFDNAEFVVTDSFHGTAFSMIFNKNFYTIPYKGTNSRIENILSIFGFEDRLITKVDEVQTTQVDYSNFDGKVNENVSFAKRYLDTIVL